jgi:hypothetical protein
LSSLRGAERRGLPALWQAVLMFSTTKSASVERCGWNIPVLNPPCFPFGTHQSFFVAVQHPKGDKFWTTIFVSWEFRPPLIAKDDSKCFSILKGDLGGLFVTNSFSKWNPYQERLLHSLRSFAMTRIMDVARLSGRFEIINCQYVDSLIVILNCRHCEERSDVVYLPFGRQSWCSQPQNLHPAKGADGTFRSWIPLVFTQVQRTVESCYDL